MSTEPDHHNCEFEFLLVVYELKSSVSHYLSLADVDGVHTLEELVEFNRKHAAEELPKG